MAMTTDDVRISMALNSDVFNDDFPDDPIINLHALGGVGAGQGAQAADASRMARHKVMSEAAFRASVQVQINQQTQHGPILPLPGHPVITAPVTVNGHPIGEPLALLPSPLGADGRPTIPHNQRIGASLTGAPVQGHLTDYLPIRNMEFLADWQGIRNAPPGQPFALSWDDRQRLGAVLNQLDQQALTDASNRLNAFRNLPAGALAAGQNAADLLVDNIITRHTCVHLDAININKVPVPTAVRAAGAAVGPTEVGEGAFDVGPDPQTALDAKAAVAGLILQADGSAPGLNVAIQARNSAQKLIAAITNVYQGQGGIPAQLNALIGALQPQIQTVQTAITNASNHATTVRDHADNADRLSRLLQVQNVQNEIDAAVAARQPALTAKQQAEAAAQALLQSQQALLDGLSNLIDNPAVNNLLVQDAAGFKTEADNVVTATNKAYNDAAVVLGAQSPVLQAVHQALLDTRQHGQAVTQHHQTVVTQRALVTTSLQKIAQDLPNQPVAVIQGHIQAARNALAAAQQARQDAEDEQDEALESGEEVERALIFVSAQKAAQEAKVFADQAIEARRNANGHDIIAQVANGVLGVSQVHTGVIQRAVQVRAQAQAAVQAAADAKVIADALRADAAIALGAPGHIAMVALRNRAQGDNQQAVVHRNAAATARQQAVTITEAAKKAMIEVEHKLDPTPHLADAQTRTGLSKHCQFETNQNHVACGVMLKFAQDKGLPQHTVMIGNNTKAVANHLATTIKCHKAVLSAFTLAQQAYQGWVTEIAAVTNAVGPNFQPNIDRLTQHARAARAATQQSKTHLDMADKARNAARELTETSRETWRDANRILKTPVSSSAASAAPAVVFSPLPGPARLSGRAAVVAACKPRQ